MLLLQSLLENLDKQKLFKLQQLLVDSELSDDGWSFDLDKDGIVASNDNLNGLVSLGPLSYGVCKGNSKPEIQADISKWYTDSAHNPKVTSVVVHSFGQETVGDGFATDVEATVTFASANDVFKAALVYEGHADQLGLYNMRGELDNFVNTLQTAKAVYA